MLKITDAAHNHLIDSIIETDFLVLYVRFKRSGCSAYSSLFEIYQSFDELQEAFPNVSFDALTTEHYSIVWDTSFSESLSEASLDYQKIDSFTTKLVLDLPTKTNVCGCGESFSF